MMTRSKVLLAALFSFVMAFPVTGLQVQASERVEWADLHWNPPQVFELIQDLELENGVAFKEGQRFMFMQEIGLDSGPIVIELQSMPCPFPMKSSELVLVWPKDVPTTGRDRRVGVRMDPGCHLEVYLEGGDYYSPSFFRR